MIAELLDLSLVSLASKLTTLTGLNWKVEREIEGQRNGDGKNPCVISAHKGMAEARIPNSAVFLPQNETRKGDHPLQKPRPRGRRESIYAASEKRVAKWYRPKMPLNWSAFT